MERISKVPKKGEPGGHKTPPKGYPDKSKMYADPENFKYPLDTEKHVRAALSYLSKPENQKNYTKSELKTMFNRIHKRCKDFGVEVKENNKKKAHSELLTRIASVSEYFDDRGMTEYAEVLHKVLLRVAAENQFGDQILQLPDEEPTIRTKEERMEEDAEKAQRSFDDAHKTLDRFEKFKSAVDKVGLRLDPSETGSYRVLDGNEVVAIGMSMDEVMDAFLPIYKNFMEVAHHNDKLQPYGMKIEIKERDGKKTYTLFNMKYVAPGFSTPKKEPISYGNSVGDTVKSLYARNPIVGEKILNILKD